MKNLSLTYIVREASLSLNEKFMLSDFGYSENLQKANIKLEAFAVYMLLKMIMAENKDSGFFLELDNKQLKLMAIDMLFGVDIQFLKDVIQSCLENELFDKKMYSEFNILTSHDIQTKYFYSDTVRKRNLDVLNQYKVYIYPDIYKKIQKKNINEISAENNKTSAENAKIDGENAKIGGKNAKISAENQQTKQNKTKQDETKQDINENKQQILNNTSLNNTSVSIKTGASFDFSSPFFLSLNKSQQDALKKILTVYPEKAMPITQPIPPNVDFNVLYDKIYASMFLSNKNFNIVWCINNYDKIASGKYDTFAKTNPREPLNYSGRIYDKEFLNCLYDNLDTIEL